MTNCQSGRAVGDPPKIDIHALVDNAEEAETRMRDMAWSTGSGVDGAGLGEVLKSMEDGKP